MVGNGEKQREGRLCRQVRFPYTAVEGLTKAVGGNESEALDLCGASQFGRVVSPVHDEAAGFADIAVDGLRGFRVAVA